MGKTEAQLLRMKNAPEISLDKVPFVHKLLEHEANQKAIQSIRERRGANPIPSVEPVPGLSPESSTAPAEATRDGIPDLQPY
jgi:hypothetical protein